MTRIQMLAVAGLAACGPAVARAQHHRPQAHHPGGAAVVRMGQTAPGRPLSTVPVSGVPGGAVIGGQYSSGYGTTYGGNAVYQNPQSYQVGGAYTVPNPTPGGGRPTQTVYQGHLSNGPGGVVVGGQYSDGRGTTYGGNAVYHDPRNVSVGGTYATPAGNGYSGSLTRRNGAVDVGAGFSTPGVIPGTRVNYAGDAAFRGRDTTVTGGATVTDPTGLVRLGGVTGTLDRHRYTQTTDVGVGGVHATQTDSVRFSGVNSSYNRAQGVQTPGASAGYHYGVSVHGASAGGSVNLGGARVGVSGSVSGHGVTVQPHVSIPKPSVPRVTVPAPSAPHLPPVSVGGGRVRVGGHKLPW
jgi:hypothetical protein